MKKLVLTTSGKRRDLVVELEAPAFKPEAPDVVVWGARLFVPATGESADTAADDEVVYREAFVWTAPPGGGAA